MKKSEELTDEQLSVAYSLYEYCQHNASHALMEFNDIFSTDVPYQRISKLYKREGWKVEGNTSDYHGTLDEDKLSVLYGLYKFCNGGCNLASMHFYRKFNMRLHPTTIKNLWEKEGWRCMRKKPLVKLKSFSAPYLSRKKLNVILTDSEKDKLDRLFEVTGGNSHVASQIIRGVPPIKILEYWKSQKFVE